jgi:hypothetical protein
MFVPNAPWEHVATSIKVFKLYPYFVGRSSDRDLRTVLYELNRRHIKVAVEARALTASKGCRMESGDGGQSTPRLLQRIKDLGGTVDIVAMDEPLKHGLLGSTTCRTSIKDLATDISDNVRKFRSIFPNVEVGDIEPIGTWAGAAALADDVLAFVDAYHRISGENLAFVHADVGWRTRWQAPIRQLEQGLRNRAIRFGIIYNGEDLAASDRAWAAEAKQHYTAIEQCGRPVPDDIVFQTWRPHPSKALPESDPESLTGIVKDYLARQKC